MKEVHEELDDKHGCQDMGEASPWYDLCRPLYPPPPRLIHPPRVEVLLEAKKAEHDFGMKFNESVNEWRGVWLCSVGLSTAEEWDQIEKCFRNNKKGICIMVSTTLVEVVSLCAGKENQVL
jgi:hypothetical protein